MKKERLVNLTKEDLLEGCRMAKLAQLKGGPIKIGGHYRSYDQREWDCGTSCCIHGFATIVKFGGPCTYAPTENDYKDLGDLRDSVIDLLFEEGTTPELVEDVIAGRTKVGENIHISPGVIIEEGCQIGSFVSIYSNTLIMRNTIVEDGALISSNVIIGEGSVIKSLNTVSRGEVVKPGEVVGE